MSTPVSCSLYESLELACLRRETTKIALEEGEVEGVPSNLYLKEKVEYLDLSTDEGVMSIRLDRIRKLVGSDDYE